MGQITFTAEGVSAAELVQVLAAAGINAKTSSLFSTRYDMTARGLDLLLRASVHYYNTEDEIVRFCEVVRDRMTAR